MSESPENWQRFGEWMLERRQLLGLSQEKAADLAGIHRQQWYRIENGASTKRSTIISIASALSVKSDVALSIAYGLSGRPAPDRSEITNLSAEIGELTKLFTALSPDRKQLLLVVARALSEPSEKRELEPIDDDDYVANPAASTLKPLR